MIEVCAKCQREYGQKPPLEDRRETHGYCPSCFVEEMLKVVRGGMQRTINSVPGWAARMRLRFAFAALAFRVWRKSQA